MGKEDLNAIKLSSLNSFKESKSFDEKSFRGIPIFQTDLIEVHMAPGTIKLKPLFFSKEDIEKVLQSINFEKELIQIILAKKINTKSLLSIEKIQKEFKLNDLSTEIKIQMKLHRLRNKLLKVKKNLIENNSLIYEPKIEVSCLEWLIQQMELDCNGIWSEILLIPSRFITKFK